MNRSIRWGDVPYLTVPWVRYHRRHDMATWPQIGGKTNACRPRYSGRRLNARDLICHCRPDRIEMSGREAVHRRCASWNVVTAAKRALDWTEKRAGPRSTPVKIVQPSYQVSRSMPFPCFGRNCVLGDSRLGLAKGDGRLRLEAGAPCQQGPSCHWCLSRPLIRRHVRVDLLCLDTEAEAEMRAGGAKCVLALMR